MFNTIFSNQNTAHLFELFIWMFVAFLIGYLWSRFRYQARLDRCSKKCEDLQRKLDKGRRNQKKAETVRSVPKQKPQANKPKQKIESSGPKPKLDFANFGSANEADKDDLKKISGVGPFIEKKLNKIQIYTFSQISKFNSKDIDTVTELIEFFPGRILRDDWVGQAKILMTGGKTDFSNRVDKGDVEY